MNLEWSVLWDYKSELLAGVAVTFLLTISTILMSTPIGILLALGRMSSLRLVRLLCGAVVEFFRNLPVILLVYWAYYVLPVMVGLTLSPLTTAVCALTLGVSAYAAEVFRAGFVSIRAGQTEAAIALGMSPVSVFFQVTLPLTIRRVLPVLASIWVSLFKDTSLVSVIAVADLSYVGMQIRNDTYLVIEVLTGVALIYWAMGYPQARLVESIHRKYATNE